MAQEKIIPARIKIVQYMCGPFEYFQWSEKLNGSYASRHGYQHVISRREPRTDRHVTWEKVPIIIDELHDCDYLLWMDADALFYSQELKIEHELIPLMDGRAILMPADIAEEKTRWNETLPATGVMLMKNTEEVRTFFLEWNAASDIDTNSRWAWPPDQLGLWNIVLPRHFQLVKLLHNYYLMNGNHGQYIRHFLLSDDKTRTEAMKQVYSQRFGIIEP